jgi:hypothetical protein
LPSSWMMDIPKWPLNSTDKIAYESEKVEIQAANQQMVIWDASAQIESPRSNQSVRFSPGSRVHRISPFRPQGKVSDNVRMNHRLLYESWRHFIHSQVIIMTIEQSSRTSPGALHWSTHCTPPTARCRTTRSSCAVKRPRCVPVNDNSRPCLKRQDRVRIWASSAANHTVQSGGTVWHWLGTNVAASASAHSIGTSTVGYETMNWQWSDAECRVRSQW